MAHPGNTSAEHPSFGRTTLVIAPRARHVRAPVAGGVLGPVRRRPLLSFFVLANVMSWLAWMPYIHSRPRPRRWRWR